MRKITALIIFGLFLPNSYAQAPVEFIFLEQWELKALRTAETIFFKEVKNTECYKIEIIKYKDSMSFRYFDKKISEAELAEQKGTLPGCSSFKVDIAKDGSIIHSGYSTGK